MPFKIIGINKDVICCSLLFGRWFIYFENNFELSFVYFLIIEKTFTNFYIFCQAVALARWGKDYLYHNYDDNVIFYSLIPLLFNVN